jgi:PPOX class probable F420-dependent enzyme
VPRRTGLDAARSRTIEGVTLPDRTRAFLRRERLYATISTLDEDGGPRQAVTWYRVDGDEIVINSLVGRRWPTNLLRDPRIAVAVIDPAPGENWVGLTGIARAVTDQATAQADIAEMARRYEPGEPEAAERRIRETFGRQERISFRVTVEKVHEHFD